MEILSDGNVYLKKGEKVPYRCPHCREFIAYFETTGIIVCPVCKFEGEVEDFSGKFELMKVN